MLSLFPGAGGLAGSEPTEARCTGRYSLLGCFGRYPKPICSLGSKVLKEKLSTLAE